MIVHHSSLFQQLFIDLLPSLLKFLIFCILVHLYPSEAMLQRIYWNYMVVIALVVATIYCPICNLIIAFDKRGVN